MHRSTTLAAILVTAALVGGCAEPRPASVEGQRELLEQRQGEFFAALEARDPDRTAELFADDAVLHIAGMPPIEGRAAIHRFYGNLFGFLSASTATPERLHLSESADLAYGIGRTSNAFRGPEGPVEYTGKYLLVWQRTADDWFIVVYGVSSDQAEAGG
jgi:ketosteroid isomerase-like protein